LEEKKTHTKKAPDTSGFNNLIEIIYSGFSHYELKVMLDKVWEECTAESEIKKSLGATIPKAEFLYIFLLTYINYAK
jgi:hypothetical protein